MTLWTCLHALGPFERSASSSMLWECHYAARILRWPLMLMRSVPFYWQMRQVELCKQYTPSRHTSIPPRESRDLQDASLGRLVRTNCPLFFFPNKSQFYDVCFVDLYLYRVIFSGPGRGSAVRIAVTCVSAHLRLQHRCVW